MHKALVGSRTGVRDNSTHFFRKMDQNENLASPPVRYKSLTSLSISLSANFLKQKDEIAILTH